MNYLIRNASVVNEGEVFRADVLVWNGFIASIERGGVPAVPEGVQVIDAEGKYLIPGIIDEHVHFRDPGLTYKADIWSESHAAVAGGVTSFMDMPNTVPQTVTRELLEEKFKVASERSLANYSFWIGATNDNLDEVLGIDPTRVCGIKLFMGSSTGNMLVDDDKTLEELFSKAPCMIAAHCEDEGIVKAETLRYKALAEAGKVRADACIHPLVRSAEACLKSSERAVGMARKTGARLHVLHVSTAAELKLFDNTVPLEDKKITAETCPHYLSLSDRDYERLGFAIKCNPSVKSEADRQALLKALENGLVDTVGTDHAPHLKEEKFTGDYFTSKSGFPSVQHSLDLMAALVPMTLLVKTMCHNPAVLFGMDRRGFIREGYHADLAIVDLSCEKRIADETEFSKCGWTPYNDCVVASRVTHTFVGGNLVYENGTFHEEFRGERLTFNPRFK